MVEEARTLAEEATATAVPRSFDLFYEREFRAVVGLAYALSGSRAGAEDLAQEAFLRAHREWARISTYERPDAWVRRVVANLAVSTIRRRAVEVRALARLAIHQSTSMPALSDQDSEFWTTVRKLPRRQSQVVALHYMDGRPVAEIADILGIAEGTVKKHLHDARRDLARTLDLEADG
jgi:RNA polymerase sigma-70 factor (ECF subfamily)